MLTMTSLLCLLQSSEDISSIGSQGSGDVIEHHQQPMLSPPPTDGKPVIMARMGQSSKSLTLVC